MSPSAHPASEAAHGIHTACSDQDTFPKSRDNSWKIKVFYRKKSMPASFPSSTVFMCLTSNFPWKQTCVVSSSTHKVLPVVPLSLGQAQPPGPRLDSAAPTGRAVPEHGELNLETTKNKHWNCCITLSSDYFCSKMEQLLIFCLDILVGFSFLFPPA